jgi:hypothetical protein
MQNITTLPVDQRRLIMIVPEASKDWQEGAWQAVKTGARWVVSPGGIPGQALYALYRSERARALNVLGVPVSAANTEKLSTPLGEWRQRVLYAVNPVDPCLYYQVDEFHEHVLAHKANELWRLLQCLGAVEIEVKATTVRTLSVGANASIAEGSDKAGLRASMSEKGEHVYHQKARFRPTQPPHVPDGLRWLKEEPVWQDIVDGRLKGSRLDFDVTLKASKDYSVNVDLVAKAKAAGFEIGGKFVTAGTDSWRFSGVFQST